VVITPVASFPAYAYSRFLPKLSSSSPANGIASSSNGHVLAASFDGSTIYTSADSGQTWTARSTSGSRAYRGVRVSYDGTFIVAIAVSPASIITSSDFGATWTSSNPPTSTNDYTHVGMNSDGSLIVYQAQGIYISRDFGATWTDRTSASGTDHGQGVCSNKDGSRLAFVIDNGGIKTSADYGVTWVDRTASSGSRNWLGISSSGDGLVLVACTVGSAGAVYMSPDFGATWLDITPASFRGRDFFSNTVSSDGSTIATVIPGRAILIFKSLGSSWKVADNSTGDTINSWTSITTNSAGSTFAVTSYNSEPASNNKVFVSHLLANSAPSSLLSPSSPPSATILTYTGAAQIYTVPAGVSFLLVQLWGGGGGGSTGTFQNNVVAYGGGAGGFTQCYLSVTPGQDLNVSIIFFGVHNIIQTQLFWAYNTYYHLYKL